MPHVLAGPLLKRSQQVAYMLHLSLIYLLYSLVSEEVTIVLVFAAKNCWMQLSTREISG